MKTTTLDEHIGGYVSEKADEVGEAFYNYVNHGCDRAYRTAAGVVRDCFNKKWYIGAGAIVLSVATVMYATLMALEPNTPVKIETKARKKNAVDYMFKYWGQGKEAIKKPFADSSDTSDSKVNDSER